MDEYGKKHISVLASKLTLTEAKNWLSRKRGEIGKKGAFKFSKILSRSSEILTVEPELTHEFIFEKA